MDYKWFMHVRLFSGQTIYFSIIKGFHNLIIKDLSHFLALFVGQKSQLIIHNIKNKSVVFVYKQTQQTNKRTSQRKFRLQHFLIDLARFLQLSAVNP